jgi:hypothetical protein
MKKNSFKIVAGVAIMVMTYAYGAPAKATNVAPGLGKIYAAPKAYFDVLQAPPTNGTVLGENYIIDTAHTFESGKGFIELPAIFKEGNLKGATGGVTGSKSTDWTIEVPLPGLSAEYLELIDTGINEEWVILAQFAECQAGEYIQIGCGCDYAEMTAEYDSSTKEAKGANRTKLMFKASCIPSIYTSTVTLYP